MEDKYSYAYDKCDIIDSEVKYILENKEEFDYIDDFDEEKVWDIGSKNSDIFDRAWEDFEYCLTEDLIDIDKNNFKVFKIKGIGMGWRNLDGHKVLRAENGLELLNGILPKTDVTLRVIKTKTQLKIKCSHHDSPMGEWYIIKPLNMVEMKEFEEGVY